MLLSGNAYGNYVLIGPDLDHLHRDCKYPRLISASNLSPQSFQNREWIVAAYRVGRTIHALIHNEYHDPSSPLCKPGDNGSGNPCWYNAVTYAYSVDDGMTFQHPTRLLVAAPTRRWDPSIGAPIGQKRRLYGYFGPSGIVRGRDGYFYSTMVAINNPDSARGTCVIRTRDLSDPASWRAWDGKEYRHAFLNPYSPDVQAPLRACAAVSPDIIHDFGGSLTYNTYLARYVLVGFWTRGRAHQPTACGFAFSLSVDLVHWSAPQVFQTADPPSNDAPDCPAGAIGKAYYPALIDESDTTVNHESTGKTPYLYYVAGLGAASRDLIRIRLRFDLPSR